MIVIGEILGSSPSHSFSLSGRTKPFARQIIATSGIRAVRNTISEHEKKNSLYGNGKSNGNGNGNIRFSETFTSLGSSSTDEDTDTNSNTSEIEVDYEMKSQTNANTNANVNNKFLDSVLEKINNSLGSDVKVNDDDDNDNNNRRKDKLLGILVLLTVPLSWGTYAPVVKYVYEMDPPLPGFVFSAGYYLIASITLTFLSVIMAWKDKNADVDVDVDIGSDENSVNTNQSGIASESSSATNNNAKNSLQALAGLELGSYLFLGNCLQVVGLKTVPADRAAFLVQLTTVMVPLFSAFFAGNIGSIPGPTWIACVLAFVGVLVMGFDTPDLDVSSLFENADMNVDLGSLISSAGQGMSFSGGDTLIGLAAVSYTMHVIRLGRYAKFTNPLRLAASKATVEAVLSIGLVVGLMSPFASTSGIAFVQDMSREVSSYFDQLQSALDANMFPPSGSAAAFGACLWTGWVTCAYTIYAQSFGQSRVNPTDANLIYTMQPIFSSLFAFLILGESLGLFGFAGASLIFFALWVVTNSDDSHENAST